MGEPLDDVIHAGHFAVLRGSMACWKCGQSTLVAAVWVDQGLTGEVFREGAALLTYIGKLDKSAERQVLAVAPSMRMAVSSFSETIYLANHCMGCDALQGDHFVHGPNGPFFPQSKEDFARIEITTGRGSLTCEALLSQASWMEWVTLAAK